MPAKVTFTVTQGTLPEAEYVFEERTTCIIGRDNDCAPQVPDDEGHGSISRLQCLMDINPPDVSVRDLGSKYGTFVNGAKIGQRETEDQRGKPIFPEYDLKHGDEVRLGDPSQGNIIELRVGVFVPTVCSVCSAEIAKEEKANALKLARVYLCEKCRKNAAAARRPKAPGKLGKVCSKCGKDVAGEMGERRGDFVCAACKRDPEQIVQFLLEKAQAGDRNLVAIRGYEILRELGRGGMGAVYLARHAATKKQVALKVMLPQVAADAKAREAFLRETENTRALDHPYVVKLWDADCSKGTFFFSLEFCDGGSVADLVKKRGGPLSLDEACPILLQVLKGLEYTHQAPIPCVKRPDGSYGPGIGLVHRDLKPHNIFLSGSGSFRIAKIGDYGLAKSFDLAGLSGRTCTGSAAGTPVFLPRQQIVNFKYAKPEVDVWAAAASLYWMLTGAFPRDFPEGKDPWQIVLKTQAVPIRERDPRIPKRLAEVIDHALIDNPQLSFKTAAEFRQTLENALR